VWVSVGVKDRENTHTHNHPLTASCVSRKGKKTQIFEKREKDDPSRDWDDATSASQAIVLCQLD
jgi:hypothetical protein